MSDPPLPVKTEHLPPLGTLMPAVRRVHFLRKLCCSLTLQGGRRPYHSSKVVMRISLAATELGWTLFKEGGRALLLVFGSGAEAKVRSLEQQALVLARLQSLVHGGERELHRHRGVRRDFP